ncbi:hypothetical protein MNBD_GAMMA16-652 [hydrothermal vent metagenome]|uniref:Transposase IS200-like domain-containing protein n=1 Tax=hydrothermal vent metagenome TaxID=652676 RepID=A0A3B0Z6Q6_9ZZZZ
MDGEFCRYPLYSQGFLRFRYFYLGIRVWGGEFWTDGYFASTVEKHGNENMIGKYVKDQGQKYTKLHTNHQLKLL